jgi:TolA-binding protein
MTRVDLHPEESFDRARRGEASAQELQRLRSHVETCRACRFEQTLSADCAEGAAVLPGDQLVLARVRHETIRALEERAHHPKSVFIRRPRKHRARARLRVMLLAAAAFVLLGAVATGATLARRAWHKTFERNVAPSLPVAMREPAPKAVAPIPPPAQVDRLPEPDPSPPAEIEPPRRAPRVAAVDRSKSSETVSAPDLFARANRARRSGDASEALRLYRDLQASFPGSAEELLSRVVIGRLLLDRVGDARGALAQFDSYLANPGYATLREEALVGRAIALGRLHRSSEEKSTWSALLSGYPNSPYAERARARLGELP